MEERLVGGTKNMQGEPGRIVRTRCKKLSPSGKRQGLGAELNRYDKSSGRKKHK